MTPIVTALWINLMGGYKKGTLADEFMILSAHRMTAPIKKKVLSGEVFSLLAANKCFPSAATNDGWRETAYIFMSLAHKLGSSYERDRNFQAWRRLSFPFLSATRFSSSHGLT